jgi:hypothetical protein
VTVYIIVRHLLNNPKVYTIYDIDDEWESYSIIEKDSEWNSKEGYFQLPDGEITPIKRLKYEDIMPVDMRVDYLIDKFAWTINRHLMDTKSFLTWTHERNEIINKFSKKLHDNR